MEDSERPAAKIALNQSRPDELMLEEHAFEDKGKMEQRGRPAAAPISTNMSKPDEMMLYNDTIENEAKERDSFAARQPRSLTSQQVRECMEEETDQYGEIIFGADYEGTMKVTASGTPCLFWTENLLYKWVGEHNYCRNPDDDYKGPWCFTDLSMAIFKTNTSMEHCSVPLCSESIGVGLIRVLDFQDIRYDDFYSTAELGFVPGDSFTICSSDI